MTSILTDCANMIGEKLMNGIIAEARYICCFKCIVEDYENERVNLKATRDDVTFRQQQVNNLIEEDTKTKKNCFFGWCPDCVWQYRRGKELAKKMDEIRRLKDGLAPRLPDVEYHSSQYYIPFKSRESKYKELLDALTDENNYMIGLHGMGGAGKTTMAKEVGKELKKSKQFDLVIDTTVSNTPDIKKIQDDIAGPLGLTLQESNRPKVLHKSLLDAKKILLILDDVWDRQHINFEEIGIPINHKGCRVLLTTRELRVCRSMDCQRIIKLETLSEEDAWNMFKQYADISNTSKLRDNGQEIAKECKGLPVAIAAIARTLKGQRLEEWNAALTALRNPMYSDDVDENLTDIYKCLRYSYDNMKNEKAKELFLLCSVYPEDTEIPIETLTRLGIGVGLFEGVDKYDTARSQLIAAKNKLIDSSLLLETRKGRVKMHDLVREVALWIANKEIQSVQLSNKNQKALIEREKNIRYLFCEDEDVDVFSCPFDGAKLEILLVRIDSEYESLEVPNAFFEKMVRLRVLVFVNNNWQRRALLSLTQSIQSLKNIRSLNLEEWKLGDISILGTLQCLETLDLIECSISELPNEITELEKLRLLSLEKCEIEMNNPFEVIERCSSLEELYFFQNTVSWLDFGNKAEAIHQNRSFPALQRYHLRDWVKEIDDSISKCVCISDTTYSLISEATSKYLAQRAEILSLCKIEREWRNLIPEVLSMENEGINDLVELELESCSEVQCLIDTNHIISSVQNVFSNLVGLKLLSMDNMEELCSGSLPFNLLNRLERLHIKQCRQLRSILFKSKLNLCNLKIMKVRDCPMLVSLFQLSTARSLVLLEKLRIRECEQLTNIITAERTGDQNGEERVDGDNDHKNCGSLFPNLKTIDIRGCPLLEFILPVLSDRDFPVLEAIKIDNCEKLKYIFGQYQHEHEDQDLHQEVKDVVPASLKKLELSSLPNFIDIFPECYHPMSLSVKKSSSKDGSKAPIQSEPVKCNIFTWTGIRCYANKYRHKLSSTTSNNIPVASKDDQQGSSISSDLLRGNVKHLLTLENLKLENFEIESIFRFNGHHLSGQNISIGLQSMKLGNLHKMMYICVGPKNSFTLQNLQVLRIVACEKLEIIFPGSIVRCLPQLEILWVEKCEELKQIIEEDEENQKSSNLVSSKQCFPKLGALIVNKCNKLKRLFPVSASKELPNLELLIINEASELEQVFRCEQRAEKVELPKLKQVIFIELPNLCQGIKLQSVRHRVVLNCPQLQTSPSTFRIPDELREMHSTLKDFGISYSESKLLGEEIYESIKGVTTQDTSNRNPTTEATSDFSHGFEIQATSGRESPSSQGLVDEQSMGDRRLMNQQQPLGEYETTIKSSQANSGLKETEDERIQEAYKSEKTVTATVSTDSAETRNTSPGSLLAPQQKSIETSVEEGTTSENAEIVTSSTHSETASSSSTPLIASQRKTYAQEEAVVAKHPATKDDVRDSQEASEFVVAPTETHAPVYLNGDASTKVSSTIEEHFSKDDDIGVSESKPYPIASQPPLVPMDVVPFEGKPSQIEEDSSVASLVTRELEQLVASKHLASENLSLLIDFLVKHPSVRLIDNVHSNRYKGYAYNCLADLLKFLQTHSALDVLGWCRSDFVMLLQDVHSFGFDKDWLDAVERRAFTPGLEVSQDVLQNLLDSKHKATQEVEALCLKIGILTQHVEDLKHQLASSEAVLEGIIQQEAQVLKARAALSAPIGY